MKFKVVMESLEDGYAEFEAAEMKLALFRRQEMAEIVDTTDKSLQTDSQDKIVLIFTVSDLDEVYRQLKHNGVDFTTEPMSNPYYSLKTAYLRDPDGTLIGLFQPLV